MTPSGWLKSTLGDHLIEIRGGGTPDKGNSEYWGGEIPWATVKDLKAPVLHDTEDYITEEGLGGSSSKLIPANTVIVATRMAVGRTVRFTCDTAINQDLKALFPKPTLDTDFLFHWLVAQGPRLESAATGSTVKGIRLETLKDLDLPLPPIPEQRKIAAILGSVDDAIQATQAVIDQTRKVKQGVLQKLLTRGIGHTRFKQTKIGEIPETWTVVPLKTIAEVAYGITVNQARRASAVRYPYLTVANVKRGKIDTREVKSIGASPADLERYSLRKGDILLIEGNGNPDLLGQSAVWEHEDCLMLHQNHLIRVRAASESVFAPWLGWFMSGESATSQIRSQAKTSSGLHTINSRVVSDVLVALPPFEEQERVAAILAVLDEKEQAEERSSDRLSLVRLGLLADLLSGRKRVEVTT
mgnify:CR=1 FL=1